MRLETLYEAGGLPAYDLPGPLQRIYVGTLGFGRPCLYANFVSSLDGVVALGPDDASAGSAISGGSDADRFVMGLLRACAEAVLVAAGTVRAASGHLWTPTSSSRPKPPRSPSCAAGSAARTFYGWSW